MLAPSFCPYYNGKEKQHQGIAWNAMKECARLTGPSKHLGTIGCQFESCPSISTAPRHISIHCRKISKYSYILQMSVSICRFSEMTFDCKIISRQLQSNCGKICVTVRNIALELHMDLDQCHKLAAQNQFDRVVPYHSPEICWRQSFEPYLSCHPSTVQI